jgi:type IV pilus assembly protein PilV
MSIAKPLPRKQRGFTLIEVLVTVVLISGGLLGVAALQLTTLRGNQEAYVRSQASVLASDILDRIRANPFAFRLDEYNVALNGTGVDRTRAGQDLRAWQDTIDQLLPGGAAISGGTIRRIEDPATRRQVIEVTIQWRERSPGDGTNANDTAAGVRTFQTRSEI